MHILNQSNTHSDPAHFLHFQTRRITCGNRAMSRLLKASLRLNDEDSWRLPDWEAYSDSGHSAWTDDARESDAESGETDDERRLRLPLSAPVNVSTATVTASKTRLTPLPVADLKALHMRFAQEREQAAAAAALATNTSKDHAQQANVTAQLQRVRDQLREFQQKWESHVVPDASLVTSTAATEATPTSIVPRTNDLRFDMGIQTDPELGDDALRQWIHLITDKMDVLASSFHHKTTQLPLKYPLQSHLDRPFSIHHNETTAGESVASWHVGGSLKTLVGEATASRLLDLERAAACLATATTETTHRYVAYFEDIVIKIQDLHQQRLREVVEESLQEMKTQRAKYKKRVEAVEAELEKAKSEVNHWQQQATTVDQLGVTEKEKLASVVDAKQAEWHRERDLLNREVNRLRQENTQLIVEKASADANLAALRQQLSGMADALRAAEHRGQEVSEAAREKTDELQLQLQRSHATIDRLEHSRHELRNDLHRTQEQLQRSQDEMSRRHQHHKHQTEDQETAHRQVITELRSNYAERVRQLEEKWQLKCEDLEAKHMLPQSSSTDASVQTDQLADSDFDGDANTTDERIARLKKRCKALESLLNKKFEDNSVASIDSSRWSAHGSQAADPDGTHGSQTLPLTLSFESSLDDTYTSSHPAHTPSRDDLKGSQTLDDVWESASSRSARSNQSDLGTVNGASQFDVSMDPAAPSAEAMMALVKKLEAITSAQSTSSIQPDEEPELSEAATPTRYQQLKSSTLKTARLTEKPAASAKPSLASKPQLGGPSARRVRQQLLSQSRR